MPTFVKGERTETTDDPIQVVQLKAEGWRVQRVIAPPVKRQSRRPAPVADESADASSTDAESSSSDSSSDDSSSS